MITVKKDRIYSLRVRTHRGVEWRYAPYGGCFKTKEEALNVAARSFGSLPYEYRIENKITGEVTKGTVNWPGKKQKKEKTAGVTKKLKPCPFCGGKAIAKRKTFTRVMDPLDPEGTLNVKQKNVYVVGCTTPDCILYCNEEKNTARLLFTSGSRKVIEERWNTRPKEGHAED